MSIGWERGHPVRYKREARIIHVWVMVERAVHAGGQNARAPLKGARQPNARPLIKLLWIELIELQLKDRDSIARGINQETV
jgi:hypothetical protein